MIIKWQWLFDHILKGYIGITLFPFIFVVNDATDRLIKHEKVHWRQQWQWLIIPFYIAYIGQYLWYLLKYRNHDEAYLSISFEKEAYDAEKDS